jgi:hypothetical protein
MQDDDEEFDFDEMKSMMSVMRRMEDDETDVSDDEIRHVFGPDVDPNEIRRSLSKVTFKKTPKDIRASARGKYHRRMRNLKFALSEVEHAIDALLAAPGKTYRRLKIEGLKSAIKDFREETGLQGDGSEELNDREIDFSRLFDPGTESLPSDDDQSIE